MHFSRQIGAFVRAGIPIVDAIETVREGTTNERFRAILQDIAEQIQTGIPFSEALARHRDVFPTYYIGILRSAEITGQLDVVLDQLSLYLERDLESRQKVKSALTYPAIILVMAIVTVVILVGVRAAALHRVLQGVRRQAAAADAAAARLLGLHPAVVVRDHRRRRRRSSDRVYCSCGPTAGSGRRTGSSCGMPLIGDVVRYAVIERFCRIISAMMKAGVPLPEAMQAAIEGANNKVYEDGLDQGPRSDARG